MDYYGREFDKGPDGVRTERQGFWPAGRSKMRKGLFGAIGFAVLLGVGVALVTTNDSSAGVNLNINIGPPPIVVAEPPEVVLVPRTQVYFVPHPEIDVFFYAGYWWSPRGDRWYRGSAYNGPWRVVERRHVPAQVIRVPRDYRGRYEKERRIPYGQWKKESRRPGKAERKERKERGKERRKEERKETKEHEKEYRHERGRDRN
jgi:hypothetical protein